MVYIPSAQATDPLGARRAPEGALKRPRGLDLLGTGATNHKKKKNEAKQTEGKKYDSL